jgi:hypothetical protein
VIARCFFKDSKEAVLLEIVFDSHPFAGDIHAAVHASTRRKGYVDAATAAVVVLVFFIER